MATTVIFGNKVCKLPGSYARVVSGIPRETPLASYNSFLLIDAGFGNGFDSLKGIKTQGAGKECVFALDEEQANYFVKGGPLEPVITALFHPDDENDKPGISTLYLIKAASTIQGAAVTSGTPAVVSLFGGKITASALKTAEHGAICNTYPTDITSVANLKKGFALVCKYDAGISKGWIEIWEGTYGGTNYGGFEVSNTEANSAPVMVYRSKKCSNTEELVAYLNNPNSGFSSFIEATNLTSVTSAFGSTNIDELTKFSGGSDTYISTGADLANILGYTLDSDYSCMMVAEANGATNFLAVALDHIINDAKGIKQIITAKADQEDAIILARENDNDVLIVTANQGKNKSKVSSTGFIDHDALVTAAKIGGRIFGLSPEIPGTLKSLGFDGMVTEPSDTDLETMLDAGVITPYYDSDLGYFAMSQAVNSLQKNTELINDDCSTFSIQCKRILAQTVKNLVKQSKIDFWGSKGEDKAANKANLSEAYVKAWTETQLSRLSVAPNKTENNYLITYKVTKVEIVQDYINVYLAVTVNSEITKVFFLVTVLG
jgi:hypothetical protein